MSTTQIDSQELVKSSVDISKNAIEKLIEGSSTNINLGKNLVSNLQR